MTTKDEIIKNLLLIRMHEKLNQLEQIDNRHESDIVICGENVVTIKRIYFILL